MNKKLLLGLLAVLVGVSSVYAVGPDQRVVPMDQRGGPANPWYGGYLHKRDSATGEMIVCSGRCLLAGMILSTGPRTTSLKIRNSSVGDGAGVLVLNGYQFEPSNSSPGNNPIVLPILLDKGITVHLNSVSNGEEVVVLYLDLD